MEIILYVILYLVIGILVGALVRAIERADATDPILGMATIFWPVCLLLGLCMAGVAGVTYLVKRVGLLAGKGK